jgi:nucleoside-diphosphate-sugar epimerase
MRLQSGDILKKKIVCIFGGTGFVGYHLCSHLIEAGYQVRVLARHPQRNRRLIVLPGLKLIHGTPHDPEDLNKALKDCDVAVNLIGILNERGNKGLGFRRIHVDLSKSILQACLDNRVPRLLHMSALNADAAKGNSHYLRSKGEAENYLHTLSGRQIQVTTFRPSVIFGPEDSFLNRFAALLKQIPLFFPLACPGSRFAPVYVGDVAEAFVKSINDPSTYSQRYDLCGPHEYTLRQLVDYTARTIGVRKTIIDLPDWASRLQASIMEWAPGKPFSRDNYLSLQVDSVCPEGTRTCPTPLEAIAPSYLGQDEFNARMQHFRIQANRK